RATRRRVLARLTAPLYRGLPVGELRAGALGEVRRVVGWSPAIVVVVEVVGEASRVDARIAAPCAQIPLLLKIGDAGVIAGVERHYVVVDLHAEVGFERLPRLIHFECEVDRGGRRRAVALVQSQLSVGGQALVVPGMIVDLVPVADED